MSFIAPLWLAAAGLVAAGVLVAHFFSSTVPPRDALPTVRFVPEGAPMAVLLSKRLSDGLLLVLRLLVVGLLGLALAGAHCARSAPVRVTLVDQSRAVASVREALDSADALRVNASATIPFDSAARGSLSAAIATAHRSVGFFTEGHDRSELVIVSPVVREEIDSATAPLLALWQGPVRFVRVAAAHDSFVARIEVRAAGDDPVKAMIDPGSSGCARVSPCTVRVVRGTLAQSDSDWAQNGEVLIHWPVDARTGLIPRAAADSQGAIAAGSHVTVAPFARVADPRPGRTVVRWADGQPAATERPLGKGCVREVAIPVDPVGDVALRESFRGVLGALVEPCGGARDFTPVDLGSITPARPSAGAAGGSPGAGRLPLLLALAALALLIAEQLLRARPRAAA